MCVFRPQQHAILVCVLIIILGASCIPTCAKREINVQKEQTGAVQCTIESDAGSPFCLKLTISNVTDTLIYLLKWQIPGTEDFHNKVFLVTLDGKEIEYKGLFVSRTQPKRQDFLMLIPHGIYSAVVDLSQDYEMETNGTYTVQFDTCFQVMQGNKVEFSNSLPRIVCVSSAVLQLGARGCKYSNASERR